MKKVYNTSFLGKFFRTIGYLLLLLFASYRGVTTLIFAGHLSFENNHIYYEIYKLIAPYSLAMSYMFLIGIGLLILTLTKGFKRGFTIIVFMILLLQIFASGVLFPFMVFVERIELFNFMNEMIGNNSILGIHNVLVFQLAALFIIFLLIITKRPSRLALTFLGFSFGCFLAYGISLNYISSEGGLERIINYLVIGGYSLMTLSALCGVLGFARK